MSQYESATLVAGLDRASRDLVLTLIAFPHLTYCDLGECLETCTMVIFQYETHMAP